MGEVGVGQTWVDVTVPRLRPRMETTELVRPRRWTERGTWRSFSATLTLTFEPAGERLRRRHRDGAPRAAAWPRPWPRRSAGSRPPPYAAT